MRVWPVLIFSIVLFASCSEPKFQVSQARFPDNPDWELAPAVVRIMEKANRGGSLIYRGECNGQGMITDIYRLHPPVLFEPMDRALTEITNIYRNMTWIDYGGGNVRLSDKSVELDVLNLRLKQFQVKHVTRLNLAVSAIWVAPEVKAFALEHKITFVGESPGILPPDEAVQPISLELRDATIAEIMDAISSQYRLKSSTSWHNLWTYHECEANGSAIVELRVVGYQGQR